MIDETLLPTDPHLRRQLAERGFAYQRLEWLGDSILDALITTRLVSIEPTLADPSLDWLHQQRVGRASDTALGLRGREAGLRGPQDLVADTVEALIGAAFCEGRWRRANEVAGRTALAGLDAGMPELRGGLGEAARRSRLAWIGEAVIEAAAAIHLHEREPDLDEGGLTRARARLTAVRTVESRSAEVWPGLQRPSIRFVRAELGDAALHDGVPTAVLLASDVLG